MYSPKKVPKFFLKFPQKLKFWKTKKSPDIQKCKNAKMSSGFTHVENVLKVTCSFECECLLQSLRTAEKIIWLICF